MTGRNDAGGVAIIGMACRFPGAPDHLTFWQNLCDGVESISTLSDEDLLSAGVPTELLSDPSYVKAASMLPNIDGFDAEFFEYSPQEARLMDPQQRLLLEVAWEAFEDAGQRVGHSSQPIGVFTGLGGAVSSYLVDRLPFSADLPGFTGSLAHLGNDKDFPSTRISYKLDLTGPSINVQTACSTSLVAVHLACQSILSGECRMALVGAATVRVPQRVGYTSAKGGILSPDGHCRAFDAAAQGTIFGSGVGAIVLKDLTDAKTDRNHIYAVIRGSAINNDGAAKVSYTASSAAGQAQAILEALELSGVSPEDIGYIECHGTGTIVGDPLEVDALTRAFRAKTHRTSFCAVGSVKTNIGHLEQTAGLAALIKASLALKHGKIPASLNFRQPNAKIDFSASPFFVNTHCRDWPGNGRPRCAGVNSLGLGGTNAFVVLEEPPAPAADTAEDSELALFTLSAKSPPALRKSMARYIAALSDVPKRLADVCFTQSSGRTHFKHRFAVVVGSTDELRDSLVAELPGSPARNSREEPRLAFLFSGQASQYRRMGSELYSRQLVFRREVDRCTEIVGSRLGRPLTDVLLGDHESAGLIDETAYTQPLLFAVQAGLIALWRSWGIHPNIVLGHSVGEFAAAYCAEAYTLEQALCLLVERALLMQDLPREGAMAVVFSDRATVAAAVEKCGRADLTVAAVNGPYNTVVSGARDAVTALVAQFEAIGIRCQALTVSHAFHSPLMQPAANQLRGLAAGVRGVPPKTEWVSTVTAAVKSEPPDGEYWRNHALDPVRFMDAIVAVSETGVSEFIEIGPGNTLVALGRQCTTGRDQTWLGSLSERGESRQILTSLGELYQRGYDVDWENFNRASHRRRVSLPSYPFQHRRFWIDPDCAGRSTAGRLDGLTGTRLRSPLSDVQFESTYSLQRFPYLDHHRIYGMPVLPTTAGLSALRNAACQYFGSDAVEIANLQYRQAMVLPENGGRIVQSILTPVNESTVEFRFVSTEADGAEKWETHMVGVARRVNATSGQRIPEKIEQILQRCGTTIPIDGYYEVLNAVGLEYGASFRAIQMLRRGSGEVVSRVRLPAHLSLDRESGPHPAFLDACLHLYPALVDAYGDFTQPLEERRRTHLPFAVEHFHCTQSGLQDAWVHGVRRQSRNSDPDVLTVDISILHEDGRFAGAIEGLSLKRLPPEALRSVSVSGAIDSSRQLAVPIATPRALGSIDVTTLSSRLQEARGSVRRELLLGFVSQAAAKTLGLDETIDPDRPLGELGLDSLMSVTLVNQLEAALGIEVSTVMLIQGPSIAQVVDELLPMLPESGEDVGSDSPEAELPDSPTKHFRRTTPIVVESQDYAPLPPIDTPSTNQTDADPRPITIPPLVSAEDWLVVVGPRRTPRLRLFCFPFAGGGSAVYRSWERYIDPAIEVVAIEPPGRLSRITEPTITNMNDFVDRLVPEITPLLDRPFALFGHCLGALTMYETARRLIHTTSSRPEHLFVCGARPPDRITDQGSFEERVMRDLLALAQFRVNVPAYIQPDDVFADLIRHFNIDATEQFLSDPELRRLMLPVVRAEFQMATDYKFTREPPWEIPITCFAAKGDPYVSRKHALGWGRFTNSRLQVHIREGAHFAVVEDVAFIHKVINHELRT